MAEVAVRRVLAPNPSPMTAEGTNTWIVGRGSVGIIDPGPDSDLHLGAILAALDSGEAVEKIMVTHAHLDHSALAPKLARVTGAPVLGFGRPHEGRSAAMNQLAQEGLAGGGEGVDASFAPDVRLADGDEVAGRGWRLDVLHTPGHFSGHLSFALGDMLFSGDHVMGWAPSLVSPPDGDMSAYVNSLIVLSGRSWQRMLPGHGADIADPASRLQALISHRRAREAAVLEALRSGPQTLPELVAVVYADTPSAMHAAAARNALAHLVDLAGRGLVAADPAMSATARFRRLH